VKEVFGREKNIIWSYLLILTSTVLGALRAPAPTTLILERFLEKSYAKTLFFMFAQKNQKAVFFGTPRPKKHLQHTLVSMWTCLV